jgi:hypothetical protein
MSALFRLIRERQLRLSKDYRTRRSYIASLHSREESFDGALAGHTPSSFEHLCQPVQKTAVHGSNTQPAVCCFGQPKLMAQDC